MAIRAPRTRPRLIGAGDTAEGVAAILEVDNTPQLVPAPLSELDG